MKLVVSGLPWRHHEPMTVMSQGEARGLGAAPVDTKRWSAVFGVGLAIVLAWGCWFAISAYYAPVRESANSLEQAVMSNDVAQWRLSSAPPDGLLASSGYGPGAAQAGPGVVPGGVIVWLDRSGRPHWTEVSAITGVRDGAHPADQLRSTAQVTHWLAGEAGAARPFSLAENRPPAIAGMLFGLLGVGMIVFGPAPRRGTRWYWFWLAGVSFGLGLLNYAWRECLRPAPLTPRRSGLDGFVRTMVAAAVLALALTALRWLAIRI